MRRHLILGAFASGKSDALLDEGDNGANKIFTATAQSRANIEAIAQRRNVTVKAAVFSCDAISGSTGALLIDDIDRLSLEARQAILASTKHVIATSRIMLDGFDTVVRLSQAVRMPPDHQKLVSMMFRTIDAKFRMQPGHGVVIQPLPEITSDEHARQAANLLCAHTDVADTVVLGPCSQRFRVALSERNRALQFFSADEFYGCSATNVVVLANGMSPEELLDSLTRARGHLTVAFNAMHPPELLALIRPEIEALVPRASPWVNWESFVPCDASRSAGKRQKLEDRPDGLAAVRPRTVTALVEWMAAKARQLGISETQPALDFLARELGWTTVPTAAQDGDEGGAVLDALGCAFARKNDLHRVAGLAAEQVVLREVCFVEPTTEFIMLPEAVQRFERVIECEDDQFLRSWAEVPFLRTLRQSEAAWNTTFEHADKWGPGAAAMARRLAQSPCTPHVVLPSRVARWRAEIQWAIDLYSDPAHIRIPDRAYWILGAVSQLTEHGAQNGDLLDLLCAPAQWDQAVRGELCGADSMFRVMSDRARHFLCRTQMRFIAPQVSLKESHGFRGAADFVINEDTVLELKCSQAAADSSSFKVAWPMQAAIYAYTLRKETAYVLNLNQNLCCKIVFKKNQFI